MHQVSHRALYWLPVERYLACPRLAPQAGGSGQGRRSGTLLPIFARALADMLLPLGASIGVFARHTLAFQTRHGDALREVALEQQEDDHYWHHNDYCSREQQPVVRAVLANGEGGERDGQVIALVIGQHDQGPDEVVP